MIAELIQTTGAWGESSSLNLGASSVTAGLLPGLKSGVERGRMTKWVSL